MTNKKYGLQIGLGFFINASTKTEIEKRTANTLQFNDVDTQKGTVNFPSSNRLLLSHQFSMYEIPLEFYYTLSDKKIGFAIASGVSHTIIKENEVFIQNGQDFTKIGSLKSVLNQSFSANFKVYSF